MKNKLIIAIAITTSLLFLSGSFVSGFVMGTVFTGTHFTKDFSITENDGGSPHLNHSLRGDDFELLEEVYDEIKSNYVDDVKDSKIIDGAIDGMIESLDDPYTRRLKNEEYKGFQEHITGEFGGVGMELGVRDDKLTVIAPLKDTPADRAGVQAGDIITTIEGTPTTDMPIETAVKLIRGKMGTLVKLSFKRENGTKYTRVITRARIKVPSVEGEVLDGDIGYVSVSSFNVNTNKEFVRELSDLEKNKVKGIIIDLRNNPGGLLSTAVNMIGQFINNEVVVSIEERGGPSEDFYTGSRGNEEIPIVVLVNKGSASASEIFAGAVQDLDRGIVVGQRTFGKGSVQEVHNLSDESGLTLTTAIYRTPKGRSLHKKGIKPDIVIKIKHAEFINFGTDKDKQLNKAKEVLRDLIGGTSVKKIKKKS